MVGEWGEHQWSGVQYKMLYPVSGSIHPSQPEYRHHDPWHTILTNVNILNASFFHVSGCIIEYWDCAKSIHCRIKSIQSEFCTDPHESGMIFLYRNN